MHAHGFRACACHSTPPGQECSRRKLDWFENVPVAASGRRATHFVGAVERFVLNSCLAAPMRLRRKGGWPLGGAPRTRLVRLEQGLVFHFYSGQRAGSH